MNALLHFRILGVDQTTEYATPSDAIEAGVALIREGRGSPQKVSLKGKVIANQGDIHIAWAEGVSDGFTDAPAKFAAVS
jgi:hypothetical protein